jgi:multidrug efflux system membrane fusion protein
MRHPIAETPARISQPAARPHGRRKIALVAAAAIGIGASAAALGLTGGRDIAPTTAPSPAAVPVTVETVTQRDTAIWTAFSGRLEAVGSVAIRPRVPGPIIAAHFREGSMVHQGDLLFTIDPAPYQAEVQRLEAQVAAAGARLVLASRQQQRGLQLGGSDDLARSEIDARVNEYHAAEANLRASLASLQTARLNLGYTEVRAPISGRVGKIEVTAGNLVDAGSQAPVLTTLVSVDPIYASFDADEESVARALASLPPHRELSDAIGQIPVEMGTMAMDGTPLRGRLQLVDNVVDTASGTVRVRAVFDNADGHLMPGQFARVRLGEARTQPAISIDERAIGTDQDRRFVMVVGSDNRVHTRPIVPGASIDGARIVKAGLHPGERIVVDGLQLVRPGALVAPSPVQITGSPSAQAAFASR